MPKLYLVMYDIYLLACLNIWLYLSCYRLTKFWLHACNYLETALVKYACEVKANDARLGLKWVESNDAKLEQLDARYFDLRKVFSLGKYGVPLSSFTVFENVIWKYMWQ